MLGTAVGVLPGLGSAMAVALLLPVTFSLDPIGAFIMFAGIYYGGLFGDSTTAILMNTPGNSTAIASTFEGHRMAKRGRAPQALATAAIGAFTGGLLATILVVFFAPVLADLATVFGPAEYFALAVVAFIATAAVVADSAIKGVAALAIGLALALVGVDGISGAVPVHLRRAVAVRRHRHRGHHRRAAGPRRGAARRLPDPQGPGGHHHEDQRPALPEQGEFREALPAWLRGSAFGVPFGAIPAGGAEIPTFLAFGLERRLDRRRHGPAVRQGRDPRPGRPGVGGQRHRRLGDGIAARARPAHLGHRGDHAGRLPAVRHAAGPAAVHPQRATWCGRCWPACSSGWSCC